MAIKTINKITTNDEGTSSPVNCPVCSKNVAMRLFSTEDKSNVAKISKEDKNIAKTTYIIILFDTLFALMAGVMIFPAIFSFGLEPNSGAGLVFVTLPQILSQIPFGNIIFPMFFIFLFVAALTSGISMLEVSVAAMVERMKLTRIQACSVLFVIVGLISIPMIDSFKIC